MSMFDSYDKLPEDYIPDNIHTATTNYVELDTSIPRPVYNIKGELLGYSWMYGEVFEYPLSIDFSINVAEDAIIYDEQGMSPDITTVGKAGQQAYNLTDCCSWTCTGIDQDEHYLWVKDEWLIYPENGIKEITFTPDLTSKSLVLTVLNFRWENIYSQTFEGVSEAILSVNEDLNKVMLPATYTIQLSLLSDTGRNIVDKQIRIFVR